MLNVFSADHSDLLWMTSLYMDAAKDKHFDIDVRHKRNIAFIKRNIKSLVYKQSMVDFQLETQTLVFENAGCKVGYAVISAVRDEPGSVEIHLLIVDKKHRGQAYGRQMLDEIIKRWHPVTDIYARCYAASWLMESMLVKSGFTLTHKNEDTSLLYVLNSINKIQPAYSPAQSITWLNNKNRSQLPT